VTAETTGTPAFLQPDPDTDHAGFWQAAARGELAVQACGACGARRFPPRPMCPGCRSLEVAWEPLSGRGRIWSFVVAHPPLLPAYAAHAPYPVVVVELDEDPTLRMVGNVVAAPGAPLDSVTAEALRIGAPVRVAFAEVDGVARPCWLLEEDG
jgi:uncharacterized protein